MEKAKSKKKLIAIIAGAAMAFVLTVVVSVAATLAYFGQTATANQSTITMGEGLNFKSGVAATVAGQTNLPNALPGQNADVAVTGAIEKSSTKAFLLAELTIDESSTLGEEYQPDVDVATISLNSAEATAMGVYTNGGKTYLYYGSDNACTEIDATGADVNFVITVEYTIPAELTNTAEAKTIVLNAKVSVIQSQYVGSTVAEVVTALANVVAA